MSRPLLFVALALVWGACGSSAFDAEPYRGTEADVEAGDGADVTLYSLGRPTADSTAVPRVVPASDSATTRWDLGFRGTEILLNGGSSGPGAGVGVVVDVPIEEVDDALNDDYVYRRDGESPCPSGPPRAVCTAPGDGWFEEVGLPGGGTAVVPVEGRTLLLRLGNGQGYAKVRFVSYYRGAPDVAAIDDDSEGGVYTFEYVVNPDGSSFVETE
ncbi:HmuY family protein [Rubrivirga marina]|uniref:Lipoprotein n=1 Tax=Rubrivirga marina TaxID=1196024 RepID=A0A271J1J8_9BACT|nr:HmuY family protein [Rubrivirga marina]PAP76589.1 hypothetical protein BSZ37_09120 [Rubrivirga marina]